MTLPETKPPVTPTGELNRRRRERILIVLIIAVVTIVAYALNRKLYLGSDLPLSNQILSTLPTNTSGSILLS